MPHATMYFEDTPDGLIDFRIDWHQGNVDPQSPAHKAALMVFNFLEKEAAEKLAKSPIDTAPTDAIQNGGRGTHDDLILVPGPRKLVTR